MVYQWVRETTKQNSGWAMTCGSLGLEPNTLVFSKEPPKKDWPDAIQLYFNKELTIRVPSIYLTRYFHFIGPARIGLTKADLKGLL